MRELTEDDDPYVSTGYWYWIHPEFDHRNLAQLRKEKVTAYSRKE